MHYLVDSFKNLKSEFKWLHYGLIATIVLILAIVIIITILIVFKKIKAKRKRQSESGHEPEFESKLSFYTFIPNRHVLSFIILK